MEKVAKEKRRNIQELSLDLESWSLSRSTITSAIGVSIPYASEIRLGRRRPHARHWLALAQLTNVSAHSDG
jgi:hypothetical protein